MEDLVLAMNPENPGWDFRSLNSVREQPVFFLFETFLTQNYSGAGEGEKKSKKIKLFIYSRPSVCSRNKTNNM